MAAGGVPQPGDRGGELVPALRQNRPRLIAAAGALALALPLAVYPPLVDPRWRPLYLLLAGCALAALATGLARAWSGPVAWGVFLLGGESGVRFASHGRAVEAWTPLVAVGLLAVAELSYWSLERRLPLPEEAAVVLARGAVLLAVCASGALVSALVVLVAGAAPRGGVAVEAAGAIAATGVVSVLTALARRAR